MRVYLDYNATAPVRPEAAQAMQRALVEAGNPSSVHAAGRAARALIEAARVEVASLAQARAQDVTFVSGGTEANALAMSSAAAAGIARIIVGATEHEAVRRTAEESGLPVEVWPVDVHGRADLDWLQDCLADDHGRPLVCLMLANNETGVIQPVTEAAQVVERVGGWLHVDAVQAAGKIAIDFEELGATTLAVSAHKFGGPQGVGALIASRRSALSPSLFGGGQERGLRAGTENTPGIAGFGAAAAAAARDLGSQGAQGLWRDELAAQMARAGAIVIGDGAPRLPQTLCFATEGFSSEVQVMALDLAGIMISAGAACSSGKVTPSATVSAMGRPDLAGCSVRVSGGWNSRRDDWRAVAEPWSQALERRRARARQVA